jgi:hypothetical protein
MSENKRRNSNPVPLASFVTWAAIGLFACAGGLAFVWCKNDLHLTGSRIKELEREFADLRNKNEVSRARIAQLSSTRALQDRFDTGFIKLTKITDDRIVTIRPKATDKAGNELRAVSNEKGRK